MLNERRMNAESDPAASLISVMNPGLSASNVEVGTAVKGPEAPVRAGWSLKAPVYRPIYIEHKKKVPLSTFELRIDELNPLQRRALDKLPTVNGVPVIRAIGQQDGLGFTFVFRIDPTHLTAQALPSLLERWDEIYEVAKAKAGLTPKPEAPAEPLKPRSPRRRTADGALESDGETGRSGFAVVDMSVVDAAIAAHDAKGFAAIVRGDGASDGDQADPVGSSIPGDWEAVLQDQAQEEDQGDRGIQPAALGGGRGGDLHEIPMPEEASIAGAQPQDERTSMLAGSARESSGQGAEPLASLPQEYVLSTASIAPSSGRSRAKPAGQKGNRKSSQAVSAIGPSACTASTDEHCRGEGGLSDLPAIRLAACATEEAARLWVEPGTGTVWSALCLLELSAAEKGTVTANVKLLPLVGLQLPLEGLIAGRVAVVQRQAMDWIDEATDQLNGALVESIKRARIPVPQRMAHLSQALTEMPQWLENLQALLVDLERAGDLARRIDQHLLAMPAWGLEVLNTLRELPDWHRAYCDSASVHDAVALLNRWSGPLAALQLTRQIGLFADRGVLNLQRQLTHLIDHARRWCALGSSRSDCARVLAAWIDAAHQYVPTEEKTVKTQFLGS